jgi:tetratricopeptide (TPR) repeat protein
MFYSAFSLLLLAVPNQVLEVCLSPGCMADGASEALVKLQALAPSDWTVEEGGCESLCGKGPIVIQNPETKKILHKRISGDALLTLLEELEANVPDTMVQGYNIIAQADEAVKKKSNEKAVQLYEEGISMALEAAKSYGGSLSWLAKALRSLATCQLAIFEKEAALEAIELALALDDKDSESLEVKVQVCQATKDTKNEYAALQAYFALPVPDAFPRDVANRRRTLGFRLQTLEREFGN